MRDLPGPSGPDPAGSKDIDLSQLDRLLGDVLLEGEIARTARAAVFRVRLGRLGTSLALRVGLHPGGTEDLARFRHEVRLLSETRHPNVVEVYDYGVLPGGFPFLIMELLAGQGVADRLRAAGWDAFYDAAAQAAAGLAHIHRLGVVHRDIKPANLGLAQDPGFRLKILGFGLAQETRAPLDRRIRGTLAYTAPEVLLQDSYDHRADLYSLGMTLLELATGVLPSGIRDPAGDTAGDETAAIRFHREGSLPDPLALRPDMPPPLARILRRLLQRDPGERYASAGRLLLDLAAAAGRPLDLGRGASTVLAEVVKVINSTLDLQEVLRRAMDLVLESVGGESGRIVLSNRLTGELEIAVARNVGRAGEAGDGAVDGDGDGRDGQEGDEERRLSESVVRRVLASREPVLTADALTDGRFAGSQPIAARHVLSILCVPLAIKDRLVGAVYVDHRESRHLFGQSDLELLTAFADQTAIALDNARLSTELEASRQRLKEENGSLRSEVLSTHSLGSLIGRSRVISDLKQMLERVAQGTSTVLVRGESGTGKGMVARILHAASPRRQAPFIHFNCAALPETLVESELFGHEKGAFTGATGTKPGRFELAHQGTIFLDEIGKVSPAVQAKLLRVVEEKEFERVGGTRTLRADVRILAATNLDLEAAIARNEFREDLFYRLNIIPIVLPPLRERREDIPYLVEHFLAKISRDQGRPPKELDPAVLGLFAAYAWPGNVRELEAAIHRAFVLSGSDTLTIDDFGWIAPGADAAAPRTPRPPEDPGLAPELPAIPLAGGGYEEALDRYDRELILAGLAQCHGKIRETARLLGIARNTLRAKMKKYGLQAAGE